jgi:hypothetical protein
MADSHGKLFCIYLKRMQHSASLHQKWSKKHIFGFNTRTAWKMEKAVLVAKSCII